MSRSLLIAGSGRRVREAALPALRRMPGRYDLRAILARTKKRLEVGGETHEVGAFSDLRAPDLRGVDLVYVAVAKTAVPEVLGRLARFDLSQVDLLIDTPVLLFRHFRHAGLLRRFRRAWVAEDCAELPWIDAARRVVERGDVGRLVSASFLRSAYAYHALATLKSVFACDRIVRARRQRLSGGRTARMLRFASGQRAFVLEPRDYAAGSFVLFGTKGSISDLRPPAQGTILLEPILAGEDCVGFRAGDVETRLDDDEVALMRGADPAAGVTARMEGMKRVGFLRLLRRIDAGEGAYPLEQGLDDMVVDYALEKLGFWLSTPFTSARSRAARALFAAASRLAAS